MKREEKSEIFIRESSSTMSLYSNITDAYPGHMLDSASSYPNLSNNGVTFGDDFNESVESNSTGLYYAQDYRIVHVLFNIIVFCIGIVGNVLVVAVIARSRTLHTPTNCYLTSLALSDCLVLLAATAPAIPEPFFQITEWPWGRPMCSLLVFLQYLGTNASALTISAFTVERYIAICHPMRAHIMCTTKRAKRISIGLWTFTFLYCSPWIGLTTTVTQMTNNRSTELCTFRLQRNTYLAYYVIDLVAFYLTPLIMAAVMYGLMARTLLRTIPRGRHNKYICVGARRTLFVSSDLSSHSCSTRSSAKSKIQVIRMLVVVVSVFAIGWLPYRSLVVYNSLTKVRYLNHWFLLFCRLMIYTNSAINPLLYNAMSARFRRAFTSCLVCRTKSVPSESDVRLSDRTSNQKTTTARPT